MHIYGIEKNGTDELRSEWLVDTVVQDEGGTNWESSIDILTTIMCKTDSYWEFAI